MADNFTYKNASGSSETGGADEVTDGTLGSVKVPYVKLMDGDLNSTTKYGTTNGLPVTDPGTGTTSDAVVAAGAAGSNSAKLRRLTTDLDAVKTSVAGATPAGTNIIGKVTTDQTTHGTTDLVAADITKVAGASVATGHGTASGALRVELPTDGTGQVTANAGTNLNTSALATSTNITGGGQKTQVVDGSGNVVGSTLDVNGNRDINAAVFGATSDFWPFYNNMSLGTGQVRVDLAGALVTRGAVVTDEGTGRTSFTGSSINHTLGSGNATFTNGSTTVTGTGFTTTDVHYLDYIKLGTDAESAYAEVAYINSDTLITLFTPYTGTGGTGAGVVSQVATTTGTGATISVASGALTMALGTNTSATTYITRPVSDGPLIASLSTTISQRVANQDIYIGAETTLPTPQSFARFHFTGTTNTQVITETGYNPTGAPTSSEQETNTITLPAGATTAASNDYRIEQQADAINFSINNVLVATHTKRIPHVTNEGQNAFTFGIRGVNSGSVTNTNLVVDYMYAKNFDRVDTYQSTPGTGTNSQIVSQKAATTTSNTLQNAVAATGNGIALNTDGMSTASFTVSGTFVGTITFEGTEDGTNFASLPVRSLATGTGATTSTTTGTFTASCTGLTSVRARISAYTSGNITVTAHATPLNFVAPSLSAGSTGLTGATVPTGATYTGGQAQTALPTANSTGQLTGELVDKFGRRVVIPGTFRDLVGTQTTTISASTSETTIVTAAASVFNDITTLMISNTSATATRVDIRDTTAGTVLFSIYVPAGDVRGVSPTRPLPQTSVNTNWTAQSSASVTDLRVYVVFDKNR